MKAKGICRHLTEPAPKECKTRRLPAGHLSTSNQGQFPPPVLTGREVILAIPASEIQGNPGRAQMLRVAPLNAPCWAQPPSQGTHKCSAGKDTASYRLFFVSFFSFPPSFAQEGRTWLSPKLPEQGTGPELASAESEEQ